jgi:hypothetical protein
MDKDIRAQRVQAKLHAVERSIDDTMALAAELMIEMRGGAADLKIAAQVGDGALAKLVQAMTELQAARTSVVSTHKRLDKIREALGLRTVAGFDYKGIADDLDVEVRDSAPATRLTA